MTRTSLLVSFAALSLFGTAACSKKVAPPAPATAPAATARAVDPDASLGPNERLALQKLAGTTLADVEVTAAQAAARQQMTKEDAWVLLGRAWVKKARESADPGFYLNADACAAVVLATNPEDAMALDLRGLVLLNAHKFEEARALAEKITERRPDDPMAWGTASDALLELGRYDEATAAAQRMVDLKPNLPSYSRAAHLQWLHGDVVNAKLTVRAALDAGRDVKRDPEPGAWVLVQAAMMFWSGGDYEGAEAGFDRALTRVPGFAPATVGMGRVAMAHAKYARAAELFERAWKESPLVETAWLLGDVREAAGDENGAREAYAFVERDGKRTDPRTLAAFWATKGTHTDEAIALASREYEIRKDIVSEDALAWSLHRAGRDAEAKTHIAAARKLGTPDARLAYHEGAIRIALGETASGKQLVEIALKMNPAFDPDGANEAHTLLADKLATR